MHGSRLHKNHLHNHLEAFELFIFIYVTGFCSQLIFVVSSIPILIVDSLVLKLLLASAVS
jgi:hypothetical protein